MRILFVSMEYPPETGWGGIGTFAATLAPALARLGHDAHVLSVAPGQSPSDFNDGGVHVHRRPRWGRWLERGWRVLRIDHAATRLSGAMSVRWAMTELGRDFDVVEIPDWFAEGLLIPRGSATALVAQIHTPLAMIAPWEGWATRHDVAVASWLEGFPLRRADVIVSPTHAVARAVGELYRLDMGRITVLPLPVNAPQGPLPVASGAPPRVLFVGRIEPLKNPMFIVRVAKEILRKEPDAEFLFVGKANGDHATTVKQAAQELRAGSAIRFVGHLHPDELDQLRLLARVCVVPSRYESASYAVLEAMAAGRPVVAARVGGIPELVEDGVHGFLVEPDDVGAWTEAILQLLNNGRLADEMGQQGRDAATSTFHPDRIAAQRVALYEGI